MCGGRRGRERTPLAPCERRGAPDSFRVEETRRNAPSTHVRAARTAIVHRLHAGRVKPPVIRPTLGNRRIACVSRPRTFELRLKQSRRRRRMNRSNERGSLYTCAVVHSRSRGHREAAPRFFFRRADPRVETRSLLRASTLHSFVLVGLRPTQVTP